MNTTVIYIFSIRGSLLRVLEKKEKKMYRGLVFLDKETRQFYIYAHCVSAKMFCALLVASGRCTDDPKFV